jgi:hypothetical protein
LNRLDLADRQIGENFLQGALHENPSILPIDEIDGSFSPLISLGREIAMIDNLFISPSGRLTVVETKLWRNPESLREVVGQILDYTVKVSSWSYLELEDHVRRGRSSPLQEGISLYQHVVNLHPDEVPVENQFVDEVQRTLRTSRFLLLIVGDGIRESVERMLEHLHNHPQRLFTFGLIEIQIYENPAVFPGKILLPQVIAKTTEIVRAVVRVQTAGEAQVSVAIEDSSAGTSGSVRKILSEEVFFDEVKDEEARSLFKTLLSLADDIGAEKSWGSTSVSIRLPDPKGTKRKLTLLVLTTAGEAYTGWLARQLEAIGLPSTIACDYVKALCKIVGSVTPHKEYPDVLSRNLKAKEIAKNLDEVVGVVSDTVQEIRNQSNT